MNLSYEEQKIIELIRHLRYGKVIIKIQDNKPVLVESISTTIKLTNIKQT